MFYQIIESYHIDRKNNDQQSKLKAINSRSSHLKEITILLLRTFIVEILKQLK